MGRVPNCATSVACGREARKHGLETDNRPPDAILGITEKFKADTAPEKINLGVGAYVRYAVGQG